ncbi:MAG: hypothetical protein WA324_23015 [Bryobacteraceae bacterium]
MEEIYRSRSRPWDSIALILLLRPLRCLVCNKRYFVPVLYGKRVLDRKDSSIGKSKAAKAGDS